MRCYRGLTEGLPEPKQRSKRADVRAKEANLRLERADMRPDRTDCGLVRADFRPERVDFRPERADFRPERAWVGLTDRGMDGQTDKQKSPCVLQDFVPFRAAALLPLIPIYNHAKQGNG